MWVNPTTPHVTLSVFESRVLLILSLCFFFFFFFQAEDGIRDLTVTGVQTCALPISVEPDQDYLVATAQILLDQRRDGLRQAPAVGSIGRSVILLIHGPPTPHAGEGQLGAGELLQKASAGAQRLHDRTDQPPIVSPLADL